MLVFRSKLGEFIALCVFANDKQDVLLRTLLRAMISPLKAADFRLRLPRQLCVIYAELLRRFPYSLRAIILAPASTGVSIIHSKYRSLPA